MTMIEEIKEKIEDGSLRQSLRNGNWNDGEIDFLLDHIDWTGQDTSRVISMSKYEEITAILQEAFKTIYTELNIATTNTEIAAEARNVWLSLANDNNLEVESA